MTQSISSQIPIIVKPSTLIENVTPQLNRVETAWTLKIFLQEKLQPIFANWSMISNSSCCSYI